MKSLLTQKNFNILMATAVILILVIPVGIANVYLGLYKGESPCLFCGHERFGMVLVGLLGLFMIRYGVKIKYVATTFIVAFWFMFEALRHIGNHAWRDIGMGFGGAMFGMHTYTWAFVVYWVVVLAMALMLFFVRSDNELGKDIISKDLNIKALSKYGTFAIVLSGLVILSNTFQFFISNGFPPFGGTGSPSRFTANIMQSSKYWDKHHWYESFFGGNASFLGNNSGPKPWVAGMLENHIALDTNSENSPILSTKESLSILDSKDIGFEPKSISGKSIAGGIAYDEVNDEFAIIGVGGSVYFTDSEFKEAKDFARIDQVNGMDIPLSVDATYYAPGEVVVSAYNKTIWGVKRVDSDEIDKKVQWQFLREVQGNLMPSFRGDRITITTTRAKKAYTLSLAKDPNHHYAYMVSLAKKGAPKVILLKYDTRDNIISEETILEFSNNLSLKEGAKVSDFYITGSDIQNGKMLALSKSYNSLLVIDLESKTISDAYKLPNIGDAHDLAISKDKLYVLSRSENKDKIFVLNNPLK